MHSKKATIIPETFGHLKPLSMYSRMNIDKGSLYSFPEPFINYKFELVDGGATKRKLDDSHQKNCKETPAKKPFSPKVLTPDDCSSLLFSSSPVRQHSPLVFFQATLLAKTPSSSKHVACESTPTLCGHNGNDPCVVKDENLQQQPALDADDPLSVKSSDTCPNVKHEDEDKGYLFMCLTPSLQTPPTCSPLLKVVEGNELASEPQRPTQVAQKGCRVSLAVTEQDSTLSGLSWPSPVEPLGGLVEVVWNIGPPILESSVCTNEGEASGTKSVEEVPPNETESLHEGSTLDSDTSFKVEVKSVVQIPTQHTPIGTQAAPSTKKSNSKASTGQVDITSRRPVVFNTVEGWEREKGMYVRSVLRHINEGSGAAQDAVGELWSLMAHVGRDSSGRQWQHPCDLTRRNYQGRLGKVVPKMTLHKWQAKNSFTHKRFDKVPKVFERSTFP
ncbi:uncharacterized protein LOC129192450 [Dunckerocampus dactyliophorus]|uniref:uncharacterized protein LOC129192450 n=1 Tax=Dunckerocampus dactyliophorus TaxID=161453 RepID=UPI002406892D|nr:uncharacterized protein LOC129192450 [Dunckerocampus dactyliophorus]XP_054652484.1 uncharacterized protein LOC129192450 [Dunckerocampus dactyliophorus]